MIPDDLDWMVWSCLTHKRNRATLHEVEEYWSLVDLWDTWRALDIVDALEKEAYDLAKEGT